MKRDAIDREPAPYTLPSPTGIRGAQNVVHLTPASRHPSLTPLEVRIHARSAIRQHLSRAFLRICAFLIADVTTVLILRQLVRTLRQDAWVPTALHSVVVRVFPVGAINTPQMGISLLLGLLVAGCYRAGDAKRDPFKILGAAGLTALWQLSEHEWLAPAHVVIAHYLLLTTILAGSILFARSLLSGVSVRIKRRITPPQRALLIGTQPERESVVARRGFTGTTSFIVGEQVDVEALSTTDAREGFQSLEAALRRSMADTIVLCGDLSATQFTRVARAALAAECQLLSAADMLLQTGMKPIPVRIGGHDYINWRRPALRVTQLFGKRAFDVTVATVLLLACAPIICLIAIAVTVTSDGPILFGQYRLGRHGGLFRCWKFRSMFVNAEERLQNEPRLHAQYLAYGCKLPEKIDNRITPLGRLLRASSLDELPQLWNVLRGDMSLVGPRPIVPTEIEHYPEERLLLLSLRPGLTGLWQVIGRSDVQYPERAHVELDYVSSWTFARDLSILFRTIPVVISRRGAY